MAGKKKLDKFAVLMQDTAGTGRGIFFFRRNCLLNNFSLPFTFFFSFFYFLVKEVKCIKTKSVCYKRLLLYPGCKADPPQAVDGQTEWKGHRYYYQYGLSSTIRLCMFSITTMCNPSRRAHSLAITLFTFPQFLANPLIHLPCSFLSIVTTQEKTLATSALYLKMTSHNWGFL